MHPGISIALGMLYYHIQKLLDLKGIYLVLCQLPSFSCPGFLSHGFFLCPSICTFQEVSTLCLLDCFCVLTCWSIGVLQFVSVPYLLRFFQCSDFPVHLCSPVCECPHSLGLFLCPDLSVHLCSPVCECPLLSRILSASSLCLSICALQVVSAPHLLELFSCPDLSVSVLSSW